MSSVVIKLFACYLISLGLTPAYESIESLKIFSPKKWFDLSNEIDHIFQNKLKLAKNEAI